MSRQLDMTYQATSMPNFMPVDGNAPPVKFGVVHSNMLLREGICELSLRDGFTVLYSADEFSNKVLDSILQPGSADVVFVGLEELNASGWFPRKREVESAKRLVILGDIGQHTHLNYWWHRQAGGVVAEQEGFREVRQALRRVANGWRYRSPMLAEKEIPDDDSPLRLLTRRQIEIMRMVSEGNSSKQIAARLNISCKTVENHRARIYHRLGVRTAAEMVHVAQKTGWL